MTNLLNLAIKAVNIPGWAQHFGTTSGRITKASQAYARIPIVRRGVNIIADSVVSIPYSITAIGAPEGEDEDSAWPFTNDFETLLGDTIKAYLIEGAAYWLKQSNSITVRSLQWLNPTTMQVAFKSMDQDGTVHLTFTQQASSNPRGAMKPSAWTEQEIVYFRQWQLEDDIQPGDSVVDCVLDAARLHFYLTRFGKTTFEKGAMPIVIMSVEGSPDKDEVDRAEGIFKQMMSGVENAFRIVALRGLWKPQVISPNLNTLAMPELASYALAQVALGMGIPETQLTDAANYATADIHDLQFWRNTAIPLANYVATVINQQLLNPMGLELAFQPEQMDIFQDDENQRAASLVSLTDSGLPLPLAMQILGYDLPSGMTYEELEAVLAKRRASSPQPPQLVIPPTPPKDVTPPEGDSQSKRAVLRAWQRFQTNRAKVGKKAGREFVTEALPPSLKGAINGALVEADAPEIKRIFDEAAAIYSEEG